MHEKKVLAATPDGSGACVCPLLADLGVECTILDNLTCCFCARRKGFATLRIFFR